MFDEEWLVKQLLIKFNCMPEYEVNNSTVNFEYFDKPEDCVEFFSIKLFDKVITAYGINNTSAYWEIEVFVQDV